MSSPVFADIPGTSDGEVVRLRESRCGVSRGEEAEKALDFSGFRFVFAACRYPCRRVAACFPSFDDRILFPLECLFHAVVPGPCRGMTFSVPFMVSLLGRSV